MNFTCQKSALFELAKLAERRRHSILIEGVEGSGKTYLAQQYAQMLDVPDVQIVEPNVQSIKSTIEACYRIDNEVVICIENLDTGVSAAAYSLLKFLEEPNPNIYIVVTCRNVNRVPDTIISRSVCIITSPPIDTDIVIYATNKDNSKYTELRTRHIWSCIRTFKDVDTVMNMTPQQLEYFNSLSSMMEFKDTVSNMMWKLGHYPDNSETPIEIVIRYIVELSDNLHVRRAGIQCITDLSTSRIASHAVIAKFLFECKYCE